MKATWNYLTYFFPKVNWVLNLSILWALVSIYSFFFVHMLKEIPSVTEKKSKKRCFNNVVIGAGEMAKQLRVFVALTENPGSVTYAHMTIH